MKLSDAKSRLPKEWVYDTYTKIVYDYRNYDKITRKEMIKEIVQMYCNYNFMYYICTKREMDFILKFYKKEIKQSDLKKYLWEIEQLDNKYIFNRESLSFYEDYDNVIPELLDYYKNNKKPEFTLPMFMISITRINGELLTNTLETICTQLYDIDEETFKHYLCHPLVHFYCDYDDYDSRSLSIYFRDYYDDLDMLRERRKELGVASTVQFDMKLYEDFYYYGFNYSNPKVKKMYDSIFKDSYDIYELRAVDRCRLLGMPCFIINYKPELGKCINEALEEIPCAAMNGVSPKQREEIISEAEQLDSMFTCIPQNNAHLHKDKVKKFYYYYFAVLDYTNKKYKINDNLKKIFKQEGIDPAELVDIENYLWEHKEIIDDFIEENPYKFDDNDFYYIKQFKTGIDNPYYLFVGTDREYARFLSADGKIYMVKGLNADIDEILDVNNVPYMVNMHLLMFENYITYTGIILSSECTFDNEVKKGTLNLMKNALKYYHF